MTWLCENQVRDTEKSERQKNINTEIQMYNKTERQKTKTRQMQNSKIDRHKKTN